jgi:hypothetical protein
VPVHTRCEQRLAVLVHADVIVDDHVRPLAVHEEPHAIHTLGDVVLDEQIHKQLTCGHEVWTCGVNSMFDHDEWAGVWRAAHAACPPPPRSRRGGSSRPAGLGAPATWCEWRGEMICERTAAAAVWTEGVDGG